MDLLIPIVAAVKHGSHIHFKAKNFYGSVVLDEIRKCLKISSVNTTNYFKFSRRTQLPYLIEPELKKNLRFPIYKIIEAINNYPGERMIWDVENAIVKETSIGKIFESYNVKVIVEEGLVNYINKEARRQKLENSNYPTAPVSTDLPLFERCTVGTNLLCTKSYKYPSSKTNTFDIGKRYMVIDTGDETDKVVISTNPVADGTVVSLTGNGAKHSWTTFDPPMEEWFDDSGVGEKPVENMRMLYPERVKYMEKKLDKLGLVLYDHVREDAVLQASKRGVMNCYLPRLGKTSSAIATALLAESKKVAVLTTKNIRIFWEREFKRLGIKDYVIVNSHSDLEKPGKFYVMTYNWIRAQTDQTEKARKNHENYLKKPYKSVTKKVGKKVEVLKTPLNNNCPFCKQIMVRPVHKEDEHGTKFVEWAQVNGYMCRNKACTPTTNNSKMKGAAWQKKGIITHKPGTYVDVMLAKHAHCPEGSVKGRKCESCGATDGAWKPPTYKRFMKKFTMVIADEIHNAKSIDTQIARAVYNLRSRRRIGLTGTPMSNSAMDVYYPFLWAFKGPTTMFPFSGKNGAKEFENKYCQHIYLDKPTGEKDEKGEEVIKVVRKRIPFLANPSEFWKFIGPKVVRRTYSDPLYQTSLENAGQKLPNLEIKKVVCDMHPEQATLMLSALRNFKDQFNNIVKDAEQNKKEINEALVISQMSSLRTVATSPERINERLGQQVYNGPNGGGKIANIVHIVKTKMAAGEKVVILSDFLDMQKACEEELKEFNPIRFKTTFDDDEREEAFREFAEDKTRRVFIAGTRAVREGVDLSSANSVICCDLLWAPAFQTQAWSRTLAPTSEERTCEVYLVISRNSLDEHMFNVFYSKMSAAEQAFDKKVLSRRAQSLDIKFFVDKVLADETALSISLRDFDDNTTYIPMMNVEFFGERY